jgi:CspA family cold shock protein
LGYALKSSQNSDVSSGDERRGIEQRNGRKPMMARGTVKFFNVQKGFGFIQPDDGSRDVFVHVSAVERAGLGTLVEGQQVDYDVVTERGKQAAGNLRKV